MPDLSYSALANWDGRLSAPGSVNGDEIPIPPGSRLSPSPPSASPRIDPTPNGFSHASGSNVIVVERGGVGDSPNLLAERTERGAGSASEKVRRRANRSGRSLRGGVRDNDRKQGTAVARLFSSPEHLAAATDDMEQQTLLPTQPPSSRSQAHPVSPQKPTSKGSRSGLRSPTLGKREHSRARPPAQDDDADSLMDADGETDHESVASIYPIQNNARSSTTANVSRHSQAFTHRFLCYPCRQLGGVPQKRPSSRKRPQFTGDRNRVAQTDIRTSCSTARQRSVCRDR